MKLALAPIVDQLKPAGFRNVAGILEFSKLTVAPRALPALFVVPIAETARANVNVGGRDQAIDVSFAVMLMLDGAGIHQAGVSDELKVQTGRVIDALVGWTHPEASRACDYAGGRLASADGSTVVWDLRFTARHHLRKPS